MFDIVSLESTLARLPDLVPASSLADGLKIDLLVFALGSEDRTLSTIAHLSRSGSRVDRAIVWEYATQKERNDIHRAEAIDLLTDMGVSSLEAVSEVESLWDRLAELNLADGHERTIAIDVSVMSGKAILGWVDALDQFSSAPGMRVIVYYAEAMNYAPPREEYERKAASYQDVGSLGLDEGVLDVGVANNFDGAHDPLLRDHLLVIPGFSLDRTRACISYVNPALLLGADGNITWLVSRPHADEDGWRYDAMLDIYDLRERSHVTLSTFDYKSTYKYLASRYERDWLTSNSNIVFLGSKLQGLAVGLFGIVHRSARIILAVPKAYKLDNYTSGTKELWAADFSDWSDSIRQLSEVGALELDD